MNVRSFPYPEIISELYKRYYVDGKKAGRHVSSFWEESSARIKVAIGDDGNFKEFLGYGFGLVHKTHFINRMIHCGCNISYLLRLERKKEILDLWRKSGRVLRPIDSYLSSECFRQLYSLDAIMRHLSVGRDEDFIVLMIGDGYGFLSAMIKSIYPRCSIILVDIGKVLFFQSVNLQRIFPEASHALVSGNGGYPGNDFVYCPAEDLEIMEDARIKLIVNVASMQEMNNDTIQRYFEYIRRHAVPDNLFYCCNRKFKKLPDGEITEIYKYPWDVSDRHLIDGHCDFFRYYWSWRPPFVVYFDGPVFHRLTNMRTRNRFPQEAAANI